MVKSPATKSNHPSLGCARGATRHVRRHSEFMTAVMGPVHQFLRNRTCATTACRRSPSQSSPTSIVAFRAASPSSLETPPLGEPVARQMSPPTRPIRGSSDSLFQHSSTSVPISLSVATTLSGQPPSYCRPHSLPDLITIVEQHFVFGVLKAGRSSHKVSIQETAGLPCALPQFRTRCHICYLA